MVMLSASQPWKNTIPSHVNPHNQPGSHFALASPTQLRRWALCLSANCLRSRRSLNYNLRLRIKPIKQVLPRLYKNPSKPLHLLINNIFCLWSIFRTLQGIFYIIEGARMTQFLRQRWNLPFSMQYVTTDQAKLLQISQTNWKIISL